jgi:hypothetical protein
MNIISKTMTKLGELWLKIPEKGRIGIISMWHSFISFFILEVGLSPSINSLLSIELPSIDALKASYCALGYALVRALWKVCVQYVIKHIKKS